MANKFFIRKINLISLFILVPLICLADISQIKKPQKLKTSKIFINNLENTSSENIKNRKLLYKNLLQSALLETGQFIILENYSSKKKLLKAEYEINGKYTETKDTIWVNIIIKNYKNKTFKKNKRRF